MHSATHALAALVLLATPALAQEGSSGPSWRPRLVASAGASVSWDGGDGYERFPYATEGFLAPMSGPTVGYTIALAGAVDVPRTALGLRLEATLNSFAADGYAYEDPQDGAMLRTATSDRSLAIGPTAVWRVLPGRTFTPYLTTGMQWYRSWLVHEPRAGDTVRPAADVSNMGFSVGAGMRVPLVGRTFHVELRRYWIGDDAGFKGDDFVPLTVGMEF